jgi:hypothetical protein
MASLYGIWLHTTKNEEWKFYGSMVEKSVEFEEAISFSSQIKYN